MGRQGQGLIPELVPFPQHEHEILATGGITGKRPGGFPSRRWGTLGQVASLPFPSLSRAQPLTQTFWLQSRQGPRAKGFPQHVPRHYNPSSRETAPQVERET